MILMALAACGNSTSGDTERDETVGAEIARDYNNAMEKARNVEDLSFENKDRLDAALEDAEGKDR
jgi:hypothetical protein